MLVRLIKVLFTVSAIALALAGVAYLVVPNAMLGIVGIDGDPTSEFLIRTEGVALVAMAALVLFVPVDTGSRTRGALLALAGYLVVGSILDLSAFADGIVGPASVPSAAARVSVGAVCILAAATRRRQRLSVDGSTPGSEIASADHDRS